MSSITAKCDGKAAIVLGASRFKKSPVLDRTSFCSSAADFVSYLLDPDLLALQSENLLNLFDSECSPGDQLERICDFLDAYLRRSGSGTKDIILFYVGHGGFTAVNKEYFLAIAGTKEGLEGASAIRISDLSSVLRDHARWGRKYLILDCCFAASAFSQFQSSGLVEAISTQTLEPLPRSGTALLCSSGSRQVSLAPNGERYTMFSSALIEVLRNGEPSGRAALSLEDVGCAIKDLLRNRHPVDWTRPEVHSPDMRDGDIANVPLFPNPQFNPKEFGILAQATSGSVLSLLTSRTEELQNAMADLERSYGMTLEALGGALDLKDAETEGHSRRVTVFTIAIAKAMGLSKEQIDVIARGAFLHDIGKMAIPDAILRKPGKLDANEVTIMREHCYHGYQILRRIPFLKEAAEIVYAHQERFDGTGYPRQLKGKEIPLGARVFSLVDTLDAITSNRPYRSAQTWDVAREEIKCRSGQQFDPRVVATYLSLPEKIWEDLAKDVKGLD
jgi:putative nucleotidyltransferase with HDIG domain